MNGSKYYMKDEAPFSDFPAYSEKSTNKKPLAIFLVILLLIAAGVGGLYFLGSSRGAESQNAAVPTQSPTDPPLPTTVPVVEKELKRSELEVGVLNGSGIAGAANSTAATLRTLGYVVASTGNADKFDYTGITIKVKKGSSDFMDLLEKDLTASASAASVSASIDDSIPTDAQVIIGK